MNTNFFKWGDREIYFPTRALIIETPNKHCKPHVLVEGLEYKHCSGCDTWKLVQSEFHPDPTKWDNCHNSCKDCCAAKDQRYYEEHKADIQKRKARNRRAQRRTK